MSLITFLFTEFLSERLDLWIRWLEVTSPKFVGRIEEDRSR